MLVAQEFLKIHQVSYQLKPDFNLSSGIQALNLFPVVP